MEDESNETRIIFQRILVAVDTSSHSRAALRAAAELAQQLEGQLHGLFVQDETWHKISKMPSVVSVNELTGRTQTLEEQYLKEQIKRLKRRLRRRLKTVSRENRIPHTWKTVQGRVEEEILRAAQEADLITIGRRGSSFPEKRKLGSSAKTIIRTAEKPVLILKKGLRLGNSITAIYDGSEESQQGIKVALRMAQKNESTLTILVLGNDPEAQNNRDKKLENTIEAAPVSVNVQFLHNPTVWTLTHAINRRSSGLAVIPKNQPLLQASLEELVYQLQCPLLMMS